MRKMYRAVQKCAALDESIYSDHAGPIRMPSWPTDQTPQNLTAR